MVFHRLLGDRKKQKTSILCYFPIYLRNNRFLFRYDFASYLVGGDSLSYKLISGLETVW